MREKGTVINSQGSFAFLQIDQNPELENIFIHISECPDDVNNLRTGMRFEFDTVESLKKPGTFVGKNLKFLGMSGNLSQNSDKKKTKKQLKNESKEEPTSEAYSNDFVAVRAKNLLRGSNKNSTIEKINQFVEAGGVVLVLRADGDNLGPGVPPTPHKRDKFLYDYLNDTFTDFSIEKYVSDSIDFENISHPFIKELCSFTYLISKDGRNYHPECENAILDVVYTKLVSRASNRWTIITDETGLFGEMLGKPGNDGITSTLIWMVIPPKVKLSNLPPYFHGTGQKSAVLNALKSIDEHPNILIYSFSYETGTNAEGAGKVGKDPHLPFLIETLPLVLESISNRISKEVNVDIFTERAVELEAGMNLFDTTIMGLKSALNGRLEWKRMNFENMKVLAKKPCEHPWMGYPDALGHIFNPNKKKKKDDPDLFERIESRIIKSPFRLKSLNSRVNPSLKKSSSGLEFLKSLYEFTVDDVRDYAIPFFIPVISNSLKELSQQEWQKLLSFMKQNSELGSYQNVSKVIHSLVDIDLEISKLSQNSDKFNFALAMLGTSNHIGARTQAEKCISICESLIKKGFVPHKDRFIKFKNLSGGNKDNQFDFGHIDMNLNLPDDSDYDGEWARYLGAQALSRALNGIELEFAIEIEDYLLRNTTDFEQLERRYLMSAELKFDVGEIEEGLQLLEETLPKHVGKSVNELIRSNIYYLPSLLKGCVLNQKPRKFFQQYTSSITSNFNFEHPSQRTAYWCARWSEQIGNINNSISIDSRNYIVKLMEYPKFTHEAPGVILACELLDLVNRNLIDIDAEQFLNKVLHNSVESTREWVANNQPNEYDWLAPLNFNYR